MTEQYPAYPAYGGGPGYVPTEAQRKAAEQAYEDRKKESHAEGVAEYKAESKQYQAENAQYSAQTNFAQYDLDALKKMIENANPSGVQAISENWKRVHNLLVGAGGSAASPSGDSAYGQLKKAVDDVLEYWNGSSADAFEREAKSILQQIANTATHATTVSKVLHQAKADLEVQQKEIAKLEKPGWFSKAWDRVTDSGRDEEFTQEDVKAGKLPKDLVAEVNEAYIGAEKEESLKGAAIMETLGRQYVGYQKTLNTQQVYDDKGNVPPSEPTAPMPAPIPASSGAASTPSASAAPKSKTGLASTGKVADPLGPRDAGISGGQQVPAQTKVDSMPSGITGAGAESAAGGGARAGGGAGVGAAGSGAAGGVPGGGVIGGAAAGGAAGRGAAGAAGRAGMGAGGMAGRGGGAGAGAGRGGAAAAGRGPLARAKGGVAGAPKGITGGKPATPGGTGLGRGRGGAAGAAGAAGRGGMLGGARGTNQRPGDKENQQGERPDYLVEDEETWTPEDNRSVPKTID